MIVVLEKHAFCSGALQTIRRLIFVLRRMHYIHEMSSRAKVRRE